MDQEEDFEYKAYDSNDTNEPQDYEEFKVLDFLGRQALKVFAFNLTGRDQICFNNKAQNQS